MPSAEEIAVQLKHYQTRMTGAVRLQTAWGRSRLENLARHRAFRSLLDRVRDLARHRRSGAAPAGRSAAMALPGGYRGAAGGPGALWRFSRGVTA